MIEVPSNSLKKYFHELGTLEEIAVPKRIAQQKRLFSKGEVNMFQGEGIDKFLNLTIKGLNMYHYDFGIVYPKKEYVYPIFLYQVIIAPQRILALVHYAFEDLEKAESMEGIQALLQEEAKHVEMLLSEFEPQEFIQGKVVPNRFNGLIRVKEGETGYQLIAKLFDIWHEGMLQQGKSNSKDEMQQHQQWFEDFRKHFYRNDYGYSSSKRYMGEKWTKEVFEKYLFDL
ncbi:hypothetical protein [Alkaliphilus hydrothermalis]|uniref:Uncharacterized protein n=1 Tax=Alkaliphilus hydrothermalis TaxID=1482730 RepID=A0ABS2NS58_9FIRM|nr:hypothetical protein [Alkaliphilus hydrothermalis]MBM7615783.1 hypothetical protein [Alkaliphilus hydrothermalis]